MSSVARAAITACGLSMLTALGCSSSSMVAPAQLAESPAFQPPIAWQRTDGIIEGVISQGILTVDADTVSATWEPASSRNAQDNDAVYLLPLNGFLRQVHLYVTAVRKTADSLQIDYDIRHPFPSSEIAGRADLGFSGQLFFAIDVVNPAPFTWFQGAEQELIADPRWITNADGYANFTWLLPDSGFETNAWPYKLVVSEQFGSNRVDAETGTNISSVTGRGNFATPWGWHFQDSREWTGFGYLHQGQAAFNSIDISLSMLEAQGTLGLATLLVAKYADPKSGTPGFEHRLPVPIAEAGADDVVTTFGYRMPHGALDVPRAEFIGLSEGWVPNVESTSTLLFRVVDWDARSEETTFPSLKDEPNAYKVGQGESGIPELALCIPNVLGTRGTVVALDNTPTDDDSAFEGDVAADSGHERDELFFQIDVTKPAGSGQTDGEYLAWLRVTDVEGSSQADYMTGLNPDLTPISGELPLPITYFPFLVQMGPPCEPPTGIGWGTPYGNLMTYDVGPFDVAVDSNGNSYSVGFFSQDTDFGGGDRASAGSSDVFMVKHSPAGEYLWDKTWGGIDTEDVRGVVVDSQNRIWIAGRHSGTVDMGGGPLEAQSEDDILLARFSAQGLHQFSTQYGVSSFNNLKDIAVGSSDEILLTGYFGGQIDFGTGVLNTAGGEDIFVVKLDSSGNAQWARRFGSGGPDYGEGVAVDSSGIVYLTGSFQGTVTFGGESPTSQGDSDFFLLRQAASDGNPIWVKTAGSSDYDTGLRVVADGNDGISVAGEHIGILDLGGGPLPGSGTLYEVFLGQFNESGVLRWGRNFYEPAASVIRLSGLATNASGDVVLTGRLIDSTDTLGGDLIETNGEDVGFLARYTTGGAWVWDGVIAGTNSCAVNAVTWSTPSTLHHVGYIGGLPVDLDPSCNRDEIDVDFLADHYTSRITANGGW